MAEEVRGSIVTEILADNRDFIKKTLEAKKHVADLAKSIQSEYGVSSVQANSAATAAFRRTAHEINATHKANTALTSGMSKYVAGGIVGGVLAIAAAFAKAYHSIDKMDAAAKKLNISLGEEQYLNFASAMTDVDMDKITSGMSRLRQQIAAAEGGNKKAGDSFKNLGLNVKDLSKIDISQAYDKVGQAIKDLNNSTQQSGAAKSIFGKMGDEQLNLLRNTDDLRKKFAEMNNTLNETDKEAFNQLDDSVQLLSQQVKNDLLKGFAALAPAITLFSDALLIALRRTGELVQDIKGFVTFLVESKKYTTETDDRGYLERSRDFISMSAGDSYDILRSKITGEQNKYTADPANERPSMLPNWREGSTRDKGEAPKLMMTLERSFQTLADSVINTSKSMEQFRTNGLKNLLGIGDEQNKAAGQSYLSDILVKKPEAKSEEFNRIANDIRDRLDKGMGGDNAYIKSSIERLNSIAKSQSAYTFDDNGSLVEQSNKGMLEAAKLLQDAIKKPQEVKVKLELDKDRLLQVIKTDDGYTSWAVTAAKTAARNEAAAVTD